VPAGGASFSLVPLGNVTQLSGGQLEALSVANGVSGLNRPEDGSWDPSDPHNFYFNTTASFTGISRMWKLTFADPANLLAGGVATIETKSPAFDSTKSNADQAGPRMFDNMTVNGRGQVIALEDVGNNSLPRRRVPVRPVDRCAGSHRPARSGAVRCWCAGFITQDEESSGVIPAPFLGEACTSSTSKTTRQAPIRRWSKAGQLLVMHIPPGRPV
jgi:hypothetical protein